jgi:hypothetical protein
LGLFESGWGVGLETGLGLGLLGLKGGRIGEGGNPGCGLGVGFLLIIVKTFLIRVSSSALVST